MTHAPQIKPNSANVDLAVLTTQAKTLLASTQAMLGQSLIDMEAPIELVMIAAVAQGHVLLEGVPGTAKTTLCRTLASAVGLDFRRIQFTPDLLPSDVTGTKILDQANTKFVLQPEQEGVYRLPEAQLDRFLFRVNVGYPRRESEVDLLDLQERTPPVMQQICDAQTILNLQRAVPMIHATQEIKEYVVDLIRTTREHREVLLGASGRDLFITSRASASVVLGTRLRISRGRSSDGGICTRTPDHLATRS